MCYFESSLIIDFCWHFFVFPWCSGAHCQQCTSFGVQPRFIGQCCTVYAVFSGWNCDVSKGPGFLISAAHSPIYFPSSLTFMNSGTVGPNVAAVWNVACFIFSLSFCFGFSVTKWTAVEDIQWFLFLIIYFFFYFCWVMCKDFKEHDPNVGLWATS